MCRCLFDITIVCIEFAEYPIAKVIPRQGRKGSVGRHNEQPSNAWKQVARYLRAASSCRPKHCDKLRVARGEPTERCCKATLEFAKQIDNTVSSSSCVVQDSLPASPYSLYKQRESYCTARDAKRRCCQLLSTECRTRLPRFWYFFKKSTERTT